MKKANRFRILIIAVLVFILLAGTCFADVTTTTDKQTGRKKVGVAGNPDFAPFEYYDKSSGTYRGVIPDILSEVSRDTGLDFVYVDAGTSDTRLVEAKSGYAQIVSGYIFDKGEESKYKLSDEIRIVSYEYNGEMVDVGIVFGKYAEQEVIDKVKKSIDKISEEEIATLIATHMHAKNKAVNVGLYIFIIAVLLLLCVIMGGVLIHINRLRIKRAREAKKNAGIDKLTGVGNRMFMEEEFNKMVSFQYKASYVLMYLAFDINAVNKYYGEERAEEQLKYAATVLSADGKNHELVARIAGGAFAALHVCSSEEEAREWASRIVQRINVFAVQYTNDYKPLFRAGVDRIDSGHWDYEKSVRRAQKCYDIAVANDLEVFVTNDEMEQENQFNDRLIHDIPTGFAEHQFKHFLQPVVSANDSRIIGAESLVRWEHPTFGLIRPSRFINLMIESGNVANLDIYLFEESCRRLAEWNRQGKTYRISTNFTRISITSKDIVEQIRIILNRYNFPHERLVIEITEDTLVGTKEEALENLRELKALGLKIALDDLGSGYTFFSDLKDYPFDIIKIDRTLLLDSVDEKGAILMRGIIRLCKELGMEIVCEGVETREQLETVTEMGCDMIQGYYFFNAMSPEEIDNYL